MTEREYIQKLLDNYMAAETTKEEEQLLSDYFCTHRDIPAEWRDFSIMFRGFKQYVHKPNTSGKRLLLKWSAAAAIIALVFGTGLVLMQQKATDTPPHAIAHIKEMPAPPIDATPIDAPPIDVPPKKASSGKVPPTTKARQVRPARPSPAVASSKPAIPERDVRHIDKLLDEADEAFSLAAAQCSMDIDASFAQDDEEEETDQNTNIIL